MQKAHVSQTENAKSYVSRIIAELTAAGHVALVKEARGEESARRARLSQDPEILRSQRAAWQLFEDFAAKSGSEVEKFEQIRAQNVAALQRVAETEQAAAVKQSPAALKRLLGAVAGRREMISKLTRLASPRDPFYEALDSPFLIWPTHGIKLFDSRFVPWSSSAEITFDSRRRSGEEELVSISSGRIRATGMLSSRLTTISCSMAPARQVRAEDSSRASDSPRSA